MNSYIVLLRAGLTCTIESQFPSIFCIPEYFLAFLIIPNHSSAFLAFLSTLAFLNIPHFLYHTVNSGSEMVEAKHVSGKNIFWSTLTVKSRGGKIFEFLHCPFEGRANMHHKIQPNWLTGRCCLAGGSKGQCRKSKIFLSLLLPMQVDQYIFFPETCFAPTISEPEFTV